MMIRYLIPLALGAVLAGCGGGSSTDDGRLDVVATTMQVGDLVREVGGDRVKLTVLMGPGLDPHSYKASAGDVDRLSRADLVVYNGLHLEAKMADVLERLGRHKPTLAAAEAIPDDRLITFDGTADPHVWFDPLSWRLALDAVAARLAELDPAGADTYQANAARYRQQLTEVHEHGLARIARIADEQRILITAHDAFNYFGRAFGMEVVGLQGISTLAEAGTSDVQDLAALIAGRKVPAIFVETSVSPRAIAAVQEAVQARGHQVVIGGEVYSDALGDAGTPGGTYLGMMRHNIDTIVAALGAEEQP